MAADPFVLVHNTLHNAIKGSVAVQKVATSYRKQIIAFNEGSNNPLPDVVNESDLPQIVQLATGKQVLLVASSTHVEVSKSYRVDVNSGSFNVTEVAEPLEFALLCAVLALNFSGALEALAWKGASGFARDIEVVSISQGRSDLIANRGIEGWTSMWNINVIMDLFRQDMIEYSLTGE